ncbi:nicotinate-nucleotide adenylyltransferase [Chloroflexota bacterium]
MNIGVMGGTFDPIHNGHIAVAEEARTRANLAEVLFIPAGQPWLKEDRTITAAKRRLEMVRLAIADRPYFKLSTIEIERPGSTYTVDTMAQLQAQLGDRDELFFIMGWDDLAQLPQWCEPSQLVQLCHLMVAPRPGYRPPDLKSLEGVVSGLSQRVMLMDKPEIDISASEIRDRVARGLSIRHLVPEPVNRYIKEHKLYVS